MSAPDTAHPDRHGTDVYGCLTAPDSGIPPVTDEVGRRHICTCGRYWVIREVAGFVAWQPLEPGEDPVDGAIRNLLDELGRRFGGRSPWATP